MHGASRESSDFFGAYEAETGTTVPNRVCYQGGGLPPTGREMKGLLPAHTRMTPDGFVPDGHGEARRGTVYQYHGVRYHGYPPWHGEHLVYVGVAHKTGPALYADTVQKMLRYHQAGYRVKYIFSCDYKRAVAKRAPVHMSLRTFAP
jgi:hypothetical protein